MPLSTIFEMHGEQWFRRLENEVLRTFLDRRTGAVIRRLPREGLLALSQTPDYSAGALIKARA